ncbi:MAG: hypothetical protein ACJAT6_000964 [Akkermansiaceae bacterium]|jgi:hypothetical protein
MGVGDVAPRSVEWYARGKLMVGTAGISEINVDAVVASIVSSAQIEKGIVVDAGTLGKEPEVILAGFGDFDPHGDRVGRMLDNREVVVYDVEVGKAGGPFAPIARGHAVEEADLGTFLCCDFVGSGKRQL